ncbi:MAG: S9 family peptidase [Flavobacteriales bacterium]|nr:S9 family peptidase [Flavobacteriales bacterium]
MRNIILALFIGPFCFLDIVGQLDLKEIMKGHEFVGFLPDYHRWSADGKSIYFEWNKDKEPGNSTYSYELSSGKIQKVELNKYATLVSYDAKQSSFLEQFYSTGNAIIAYSKKTNTQQVIFQHSDQLFNVQRLSDPTKIAFQMGQNLFIWSGKSLLQITNFKSGEEQEEKIDSTFLLKQQTELFQYIRDKNTKNNWFDAKNKRSSFPFPKEKFVGSGSISELQIDPSGKYISFTSYHSNKEKPTSVTQFITADGYLNEQKARSKVSQKEPNQELYLFNLEHDTLLKIDFSNLTGIRTKPAYLNDTKNPQYEKDRSLFVHPLVFAKNSPVALCDIRSADNKDRWIVLVNLHKATIVEIEHQHDEAWIGGPGIGSWNSEIGTLDWLEDGKSFYFQSEEDGNSHLYLFDLLQNKKTQLTKGNFEIHSVQLAADRKTFYITSNQSHPGNRSFYHFEIATKKMTPILTSDGYYDVAISPDEKSLAVRVSTSNQPWELFYMKNTPKATLEQKQLTFSTTEKFNAYKWRNPAVITFKGSDGIPVYARIYEPNASKKNGAAVLFVHGAGYLQNAHKYWSTYFREYMFHNLLTDLGYTVLDVDYRASEGYGKAYRTAIYRHMGGRDLQDFVDAKKFLVENHKIDPKRVGIYGGSYGGFITLMGLFTTPDEFACGAALRSVTDWAHYNHEYTSNILNYPETDPEAYRKSSPINFAENLKNPLLILHGMVDDNVQFQDVVRLNQRLLELGKTNWEMAVYPIEQHSFTESYSWFDEYRRIFELFERELK